MDLDELLNDMKNKKKLHTVQNIEGANNKDLVLNIDELLKKAVLEEVSDIHLTQGKHPIFRKNGELLEDETQAVLTDETCKGYAQKICSETKWREFNEFGEVDLAYEVPDISRFRVNVFKQRGKISIAIRIISQEIPQLNSLGLPDILSKVITKNQGLILVTGPTGSGKSTTLASMIQHLNSTKKKHIITLEDPIEYVHKHNMSIIDQREIGVDTKSFSNGLRASLRQDPDIILVGELRDYETISIALTAAETGHLVLGTLHTSSAANTVERIVDVFPPEQQTQIRTQLAGALVSIISQRLLPTKNHDGRVVATEVLVNVNSIANLIRTKKTHLIDNTLQMNRNLGMQTMESAVQRLLAKGVVDVDAAELLLKEE